MDPDDELVQAFLEESGENLDQLDLDLVALEESPDDPELLARVFRTIHTVKGTCGFLGYHRLEALSHAGEDVLALLRAGDLRLDEQITTALLSLVDAIREVLDSVAETGDEGEHDHTAVITALRACLPGAPQPRTVPTATDERGSGPEPEAPEAPEPTPGGEQPPDNPHLAHREDTSVRIDVAVLDQLQDMVGELTLARLRIGESIPDDDPLAQPFRRLTLITRDLQETVMQARLQRIGVATSRLHRVVRDVAADEDKQVRLEVLGEDVTVDKTINEVIRDPLVHIVRNAVDHGVEMPADRVAAGKPEQALIRVSASLVGGGVHIDVSDDGRGIDVEALAHKVVSLGLQTPQQVERMSVSDLYSLLFLPGVSTASRVTSVSGRGVGMDAVRSTLEAVGGSVEVWSQPGVGATFHISVPLTLAVLPAVIVGCGDGKFTIPQSDIRSIVRVPPADVERRVHTVGQARFLRDRGALLPLVDLAAYLEITGRPAEARVGPVVAGVGPVEAGVGPVEAGVGPPGEGAGLEMVVVDRGDRRYGLIVDSVGDSVEAVVKPLPRALTRVPCYSGTTILADGRPSLILDTLAPARAADIHERPANDLENSAADEGAPAEQLLTLSLGEQQMVLPLDRVQRLVRRPSADIEPSGHEEVVQLEGEILPVIRLAEQLNLPGAVRPDTHDIHLVVCRSPVGLVALLVDDVHDIHRAPRVELEPIEEFGYLGRAVVADRVTEFLDIDALVHAGLSHRVAGGSAVAGD